MEFRSHMKSTNLCEFQTFPPLLERDKMIVVCVTAVQEGLDAML